MQKQNIDLARIYKVINIKRKKCIYIRIRKKINNKKIKKQAKLLKIQKR